MIVDDKHIVLRFLPDHNQYAKDFFEVYDLINIDFASIGETEGLKSSKDRTCRFCNLSYPKVTFNKKAHTIPEFLGNPCSISDFECDTCNKHFGKLEKQLSNFIGVAITLNRTKGKKKIPNSPSYNKKIQAKETQFQGAKTAIEFGSTENSSEKILYDEINNRYKVEFETQPFIPYDVYKSLLKLGLGLLPESEVKKYSFAFELLQDIRNKKFVKNKILSVYIHNISSPFTYTGILLFKKRDFSSSAPPLSLVLFYGQLMYQIYIPFNLEYLKLVSGKTINCPMLPPILTEEKPENFQFNFETEDLNSIELRTRKQFIQLATKDKEVKRVAINLETKKEVENYIFDPNKTVKFIMIDDPNFSISILPY